MANAFDEFDVVQPSTNAFDEFDTPQDNNTTMGAIKDVGRLLVSPATIGFNALGYGIAKKMSGGSFMEGLEEGAQSNEFLGANLNMETTAGKYVEEKLGGALETVREFSGEQSVEALKGKGVYSLLNKVSPIAGLVSDIYNTADADTRTQIEAIAYAGGSAAPEVLLTLVGGGKANKALSKSKLQLTEKDILASLEEAPVKDTSPLEFKPKEMGLEEFNPSANDSVNPFDYEGGIDFYGEAEKAGSRLTPEEEGGLSLQPKAFADNLELEPKEPVTPKQIESKLELEPIEPVATKDLAPLEFEKVDPNSLKETQQSLDLSQDSSIPFKNFATPEQGLDFIKTIPTDMTNNVKALATQMDLPNINVPVGQTGFGKGQRGSVSLFKPKQYTPEQNARRMNLEDFTKDFMRRHPQYEGRPDVAKTVYERLNNPIENAYSFREAIENSNFLKSMDKALGATSTRIGNINQNILHRALRYEKDLLQKTHVNIGKVDGFLNDLDKLPKDVRGLMNSYIMNNNTDGVKKLAKSVGREDLVGKYEIVRDTLKGLGEDLKKIGRLDIMREDYFPRVVTDLKGLKKALGSEMQTAIDDRIREARDKARKDGTDFGPIQESTIIDSFLRNRMNGAKPGFTKERRIDEVTPDLEKFYASPTESLHTYIRSAVNEIETAKLFGKNVVKDEMGRVKVDDSIGSLLAEKRRNGEINGEQLMELESMLKSRLGPGNRGSNKFIQDMKNIMNMGLLGNVMSAVTQSGDIISSTYLNGFRPTMMAVVAQVVGKSKVNMKDFGLDNHISEELVSTRSTAKALNKIFKWSGFTGIDKIGKTTILNGALNNGQRLARTSKGIKQLESNWGKRFGDEFPQLIQDLRSGKNTELTDMYAFSVLSKIQPVSKLELPQKYLDMPNGRMVYMLKSFMLKQIDLYRNDAINKLKEGKRREALGNLARLTLILGMSGATAQYIKDFLMMGAKGVDLEVSDVPLNVLKTMGWSDYTTKKMSAGTVGEALGDIALPPYKMFDVLWTDAKKELDGDEDTEPSGKAWKLVPVVGKWVYSQYMGGKEEELERRADKKDEKDGI
jgi:hypothetical protein